jgi:hypothetical protein
MENEYTEEQDSLNPESEDDTLNTTEEENEETIETSDKFKKAYENQKIRAEKAERELKKFKESKPEKKQEETQGISQKDLYAMLSEGVHKDDFDEVADYAAFRKISVDEALKSSVLKAILSERKEERASAQATSTKNKGVGVKASSGNELLEKAKQTGEMPDSKEDLKKLIQSTLK